MQRLSSRPVKSAVVGAALGVILLVWTFVLMQVRYERREAIAAGIRENVNRAIALEQYVTRTLEGADLATTYVADRYASLLEHSPQAPAPLVPLHDFAAPSPAVREINVINRNGELVASSVRPRPPHVNVFGTTIFQAHRSDTSTALRVNPPKRSRFLPNWFLLLSRRVTLPDGRFGGTVSVQIPPSELTNFLHHASLSDTDVVSVIGIDGITRARRTGGVLSFGEDLRGKIEMQRQQQKPYGTYLGPSTLDGVVRYFSNRTLPKYGLFVTSGVSEEAILRPVRLRATGYVAGAALISLATVLAAGLVLALVKRRAVREAEIIAANARLREAQQLARLGEWSFDLQREEFIWSEDLCTMYEWEGVEGRVPLNDFGGLVGQDGLDTFRFALTQMRESGKQQEYELAARVPSGAIIYRRIIAVPDLDASGRLIGVHGTDQDVTPRKLLESLQEQVGHLARIDGLNAIAATLAHELTQPLTAASNYLDANMIRLARHTEVDRQALTETLAAARTQIQQAGEIIRRVRNLVNDRQTNLEATLLGEIIENAVTLSEAVHPGGVVVVAAQSDEEHAKALADPVQLQQVLVNLVRNARDACRPREPNITIKTRCVDGLLIEVSVIDDGPGIVNDNRDVFSAFTASKGGGLGIGLAICRTLIQSMGGAIWVAETGRTGTVICFTLLRAEAAQ